MQNRVERHHHSSQDTPPVGRPKGATWRSLQADGVVWEGQVLLVGGDVDLAARMIVTHRRVAFVRGGEIVLEIPRGWLRQEPVLRRDGILDLFVATPDSDPFDEPMRVPLRMREGHPAAGHIIAMLAPGGVRRIAPDAMSAFDRAREATPPATYGGFWEGVERVSPSPRDDFSASSLDRLNGEDAPAEPREDLANLAPIEPPDRLVRSPSSPARRPATNAYPITGMRPRNQRQAPWALLLRIAALTILLGTAALLGAGRLNIRLPGSGIDPFLAAPTPTVTASTTDNDTTAATEVAGAALSSDDLTAVAIGVGGQDDVAMEPGSSQDAVAAATEPPAPTAEADEGGAPVIPTPSATREADPEPTTTTEPAAVQESDSEATAASDVSSSPAAVAQNATDEGDSISAAQLAVGPLRVAISTALRDESLPKYGLPPGSGEWVLLVAEIANEGEAAASISMSDIRLLDRSTGAVATLDSGTDVIAGLAGMRPAHGPSDTIAVDPGDTAETLLLYLVPDGSSDDLALLVGESSLDLAQSLAAAAASAEEAPQNVRSNEPAIHDAQLAYLPRGWQNLWAFSAP